MNPADHVRSLLIFTAATAVIVASHARTPAQAPSPAGRTGAALVYDATRKEMLLWGGIAPDGKTLPTDMWAWNGTWRQVIPADGKAPPGRAFHNLVYDPARRRSILIGGRSGSGMLGDIWEWDGARWHEITGVAFPTLHATAVYDSRRQRVVLFGGVDRTGLSRKVSAWDGHTWRMLDSVGPQLPRDAGTPVVSSVTSTGELVSVIEQSGRSSDSVALATWTWNGTAWTRRELGPAMTSLQPAASAPDGTIYIYQKAGEWLTAPLVHTRSPNGEWVSVAPAERPEPNLFPAAAYDSDRKRFVIYGKDFWEWNGARWVSRP